MKVWNVNNWYNITKWILFLDYLNFEKNKKIKLQCSLKWNNDLYQLKQE